MNPLLFGFFLNKIRGQDNATAARNALIGGAVGNAVAGIGNPVARAVVANELTSRIKTGQPASAESDRDAATRAVIREAASPSSDRFDG